MAEKNEFEELKEGLPAEEIGPSLDMQFHCGSTGVLVVAVWYIAVTFWEIFNLSGLNTGALAVNFLIFLLTTWGCKSVTEKRLRDKN